MAADRETPTPVEQVTRLYEQTESEAAKATERLVGSGGFASLLGQMAENTAALTKLSSGVLDLTLRNLRLAGRRDVIRLQRQLARTEDKLERVLQEIEFVRDRLDHDAGAHPLVGATPSTAAAKAPARPSRRGGTRSPRRPSAPANGDGVESKAAPRDPKS